MALHACSSACMEGLQVLEQLARLAASPAAPERSISSLPSLEWRHCSRLLSSARACLQAHACTAWLCNFPPPLAPVRCCTHTGAASWRSSAWARGCAWCLLAT